jgi:hypothetical protein
LIRHSKSLNDYELIRVGLGLVNSWRELAL